MTENEMTVLELDPASNITLNDILYLIQGTGEDRDRYMTLTQLRDFLSDCFATITVHGMYGRCELSNGSIDFIASTENHAKFSYASGVEVINSNYTFKAGSQGILLDDGTIHFEVNSNGLIFRKDSKFAKIDIDGIHFCSQSGSSSANINLQNNKFSTTTEFNFAAASFSGLVDFSSLTTFNSTALFKGVANFKSSAVFDCPALFNKATTFSDETTFNGNTTINNAKKIRGHFGMPPYLSEASLPSSATMGDLALLFSNNRAYMMVYSGSAWKVLCTSDIFN